MVGKISLAWALGVNHYQLGARLEAYVETKAAITTLRGCVAHSSSASMSNTPSEIVTLIADALQELKYKTKLPAWLKIQNCFHGKCRPTDHFSQDLLADCLNFDEDGGPEQAEFAREGEEIHLEGIVSHLREVTGSWGMFAKCKEIFNEDFSVRPFFNVLKLYNYDSEGCAELRSAEVSAYLAVPIAKAPIKSTQGPWTASFAVQKSLNSAVVLQDIDDEIKHRFKKAITALKLDVPHTHTIVENKRSYFDNSNDEVDDEHDEKKIEGTKVAEDDGGRAKQDEDDQVDDNADDSREAVFEGLRQECELFFTLGKRRPRYETICVNCGGKTCYGRLKTHMPGLMMLGSGELKANFAA